MPENNCVCGCPRAAHQYYRRGRDCALCDCPNYRSPLARGLLYGILLGIVVWAVLAAIAAALWWPL